MLHFARHPYDPLTWWILTFNRDRECNCKRDLALYYSDKLRELGFMCSIRLSNYSGDISRYNIIITFNNAEDEAEFILKYSGGIDGVEPYSNIYSDYNLYKRTT